MPLRDGRAVRRGVLRTRVVYDRDVGQGVAHAAAPPLERRDAFGVPAAILAAHVPFVHVLDVQPHDPGPNGDVLVGEPVQDGPMVVDVLRHRA